MSKDSATGTPGALHSLSLFALLAAVWLLLSGHYTGLILFCGLLSCALVTWIAHRMDVIDHEGHPMHLTLRAPLFWLWLTGEVIKSSWDVCRRILTPGRSIAPVVKVIPTRQPSDLTRATFANAITLTPGTLSMRVSESGIEVHALAAENLEALEDGSFAARVAGLEE